MISSEVTIVLEKACQSKFTSFSSLEIWTNDRPTVFIQELTARAHLVSIASGRRTLSRPDVAQAISNSDFYDFLVDIVARDDTQDEGKAISGAGRKRKVTASGTATSAGEGKAKKGKGKKKIKAEVISDDVWSEDEDEEGENYRVVQESGRPKRTRKAKSTPVDQDEEDDEEMFEEMLPDLGTVDIPVVVSAGPAPFMTSVRPLLHVFCERLS